MSTIKSKIKGQIILIVVILLTSLFVITTTIYFLTTSQLTINFDILAGTKALIGADMGIDCYYYLEAQNILNNYISGSSCKSNCLNSGCQFNSDPTISFKVITSTEAPNIEKIHSYGIYRNNVFRVLETRELISF